MNDLLAAQAVMQDAVLQVSANTVATTSSSGTFSGTTPAQTPAPPGETAKEAQVRFHGSRSCIVGGAH